tara:strand:- start:2183 stop:2578 length:396 start_codon:yes stop_codon:yes gene_type:complete
MPKKWRQRCLDNPNFMFKRAHSLARKRAESRELPFDITVEYLMSLFDEQNGSCYYSGHKINIVKDDATRTHDPFKMTLDRKSPEKGYVKGNIVWCAYCVNAMKQKMPVDKMVEICRSISSVFENKGLESTV